MMQQEHPALYVPEHHRMPAVLVFVPDFQVADHD